MQRNSLTLLLLCTLAILGLTFFVGTSVGAERPTVQSDTVSVTAIDAPVETEAGETVTVTATVRNTGTTPSEVTLEYRLDGTVLATDTRTIAAEQTRTVSFEVTIPSDLAAGTYTQGVFVAGGNSRQTTSLIVNRPGAPVFTISGFQGPTLANTGQTVTVRGTVENTGTATGSTTLQYRIGGQVVATRPVTLEPNERATVAIEATIPSLTAGTYRQGLFVGDSNIGQTSTIVVGTPRSQFEVLALNAPAEAQPGDPLTTIATVKNTGGSSGLQEFQYRVGSRVIDRETVQLAPDQRATLIFGGNLPNIAGGSYQQGVFVGDSNIGLTQSLTVRSPQASFTVTSLRGPSRVQSGEPVTATVTVRNTGDASGSTTLRYRIDGTTIDSKTITLSPGASSTVSFSGAVPTRSSGTYQQGVFIDGVAESITAPLIIEGDATAALGISGLRAPSQVEVGTDVVVTATVRNTGNRNVQTRLEYRIGTRVVDTVPITLRAGRSQTVRFAFTMPELRRGTYTQGVFVDQTDRGQTTSLRVIERPRFVVTNFQAPPSTVVGDRISVEATVQNRGEARATRTVEYRIGNRLVMTQELQLDAGERRTISLAGTVPSVRPGTYRQGVSVEGEGPTTRLDIQARPAPRPEFGVSSFEGPSTVITGVAAEATATVRNTGNAAGTVTVEYRVDNRVVASRQITLDAGAQREVSFEGPIPSLPAGSYQQGVFIARTAQGRSGTVRVEAGQPEFSIANLQGPATATVGDVITVRAEVANTGTAAGETVIQYRLGTDITMEETVNLSVGESETLEFSVTIPDLDAGTYTQGVFVGQTDRGQTTSLVVERTPTPTLTPSPTATASPTPTDSPTPAETSSPGFGILVVLVALLVIAALRARRGR